MGKKSSKTESTSEPPKWAVPMIQGASNEWLGAVRGNSGNLSALSSQLTGLLPQMQGLALDTSTLNSGTSYLNDVLSGKYLDEENPYMQGMIDQTANDVGGRVNATFSQAGRTAGGANQQMLSKGLADAENSLRYTNYANERQSMGQAAGMLPQYQIARTSGINPLMGAYQTAGQLPYYGAQALNGIGGLWSGYGTQSGTQPGGWGNDLLNAGMMAASMFSDPRLKTNIEKVGEASDGLGIYTWNWKSDPNGEMVRGVLSTEVKALRPHAHIENYHNGYDGVNYAALGSME